MFTAKLKGPDGFTERKIFSTHKAAITWLTGEGLEAFEGDVESAELWSAENVLIWQKSNVRRSH